MRRHDKIRHADIKAKLTGTTAPITDDHLIAGGGGREPADIPHNSAVSFFCRSRRQPALSFVYLTRMIRTRMTGWMDG